MSGKEPTEGDRRIRIAKVQGEVVSCRDDADSSKPYRSPSDCKNGLRMSARKPTSCPRGPVREALLKKARQADTASHLDDWANSTGLQPPS